MPRHWIPSKEAELITLSSDFSTAINSDPTAYGLDLTIAGDFATLNTAWVNAYNAAVNPTTRGPLTIQLKNDAKEAMLAQLRALGMQIQNRVATTNEQRITLGLTVPDPDPSPVPIPDTKPGIEIVRVSARTVTLRLKDVGNPDRRGKPDGVIGATILSYIGTSPPAQEDIAAWKFEQNIGRIIDVDVTFPPDVESGSTVWFTSFWFNTRKDSGPATDPISTQIQGTFSVPEAA